MSSVRPPAPRLDFRIDSDKVKTLKMQGVGGSTFAVMRSPFSLDDTLTSISPHVPAWLPDDYDLPRLSVKAQILGCQRMLTNPLRGNPITCIGSMPSDDRAEFLAMSFMLAAIAQQKEQPAYRGKLLPLWHQVTGGFYDPLRDLKERKNISMLIITNVGLDSTSHKLEKVRDLLKIYSTIPRIVVVNGTDPVTFFAEKMRMTLQFAMFLNGVRKTKGRLMDI